MKAITIGAALLTAAMALAGAGPAAAQGNAMKECAVKYQAAKAARTLPAGQTWMQYLAACRGTVAATTTSTPGVQTAATTRTPTPAQLAERSRQKQCGVQWKADKAAGKTGSQTWPQYWSACSKRLKG